MDLRAVGWVVLAALVGLVAAQQAAQQAPAPPAPETSERRLVSLSPPITETLFAIGAGDQVVGRSDWCKKPEEATKLPTAGSSLALNLEALASLSPTHILTERVTSSDPTQLQEIATTEILPWLSLEDVLSSIARLGVLTEHTAEADAMAARIKARLDVPRPEEGPRTLVAFAASELGRGEIWYLRPDSIHGAAMRAAGLRNVIEGEVKGAPAINAERLLELDPELVIVLLADDDAPPDVRKKLIDAWSDFDTLTAASKGQIGLISGSDRMGTSEGILEFADALEAEAKRVMTR